MTEQPDTEKLTVTRAKRHYAKLSSIKTQLEAMEARLAEIQEEKAELELDALKLRAQIEILESICSEEDREETKKQQEEERKQDLEWTLIQEAGIQECCYRVLLESADPLPAWAIRLYLKDKGVNIERYANPLAIIHTSLKRIPERVRSYKGRNTDRTGRPVSVRYYEAIRDKKTAGAETPPKN